jgi:hypothetical protein
MSWEDVVDSMARLVLTREVWVETRGVSLAEAEETLREYSYYNAKILLGKLRPLRKPVHQTLTISMLTAI